MLDRETNTACISPWIGVSLPWRRRCTSKGYLYSPSNPFRLSLFEPR